MIDGTEKPRIPSKFAKRAARYNEFGSKPNEEFCLSQNLQVCMLWFNFILGSNFLFFCFKLIIMLLSYITIPKNKRKENLNQG